jgi:hypothetical protein
VSDVFIIWNETHRKSSERICGNLSIYKK